MYSIKVKEGRERVEVRYYSSAFVPTYVQAPQAGAPSKGIRRMIVPGYLFSIRKEKNADPVPEEEWRIIEALSDAHPTFVDEEGKIVSGPLAGIEEYVVRTEEDRAEIRATLMGRERKYCLALHRRAEDRTQPEGGGEAEEKGETEMEYTQEQIDAVLADAEANGIHVAAKNAGVPWQTALKWARASGRNIPSRWNGPKKKKKAPSAKDRTDTEPENAVDSVSADGEERSPLEVENAVLRERIAKLEAKIQKLQKAIAELM